MAKPINKEYLVASLKSFDEEVLSKKYNNSTGGSENTIESISVNGTPITVDANKNVDITVPTISAEQDNALIEKQDGLYVPSVSETKVSEAEGNSIEVKNDGIYVAPTDLSDYAKNDDIPDVSNFVEKEDGKGLFSGSYNDLTDQPTIPSVDGLVSEEQLTQTLADYAKTEDLPSEYDDTAIKQSITDLETTVENVYTKDETYSREEVDEAITNAQIGGEDVDLSSYATKEYVDNAINDVDVDLTGYATETFVTDKIAEIEIPSLDGYAKTDDIPTVTNDLTDELKEQYDKAEENVQSDWDETDETSDAFIKNKPTIPSLNGYATETWVNEQGFLTQHQDLSNYATKDEIPTVLPANGGNSDTVNNHTIKSDVPENAVFTDTVYDDAALKTELTTAIATAKSEAIETILGEAVSEDFDTLQEVADWIQADTTNSAELIIRVTNAESDIDTLEEIISNKVDKVDGKGLSTNDFTDTYQSDVDGNTNARHTHSNTTVLNNTTASYTTEEQEKLSGIKEGAESSVSTVTGDNPTATNSTDGNIIYLKNSGYTEQKTLSGKNLLNAKLNTNIGSNDAYVGIKVKPSTEYTLTLKQKCVNCEETATDAQHWIAQKDADGNTITGTNKPICYMTFSNVNEVLTKIESFTTSSDTDTLYLDLGNYKSSALALQTIEAQLEEGDATAYEPYCGGIASPNPDYPQDIKGLGDSGTIEVKTCGKNLFNPEKTIDGQMITWDTGYPYGGKAEYFITDYIEVKPNTTYTVRSFQSGGENWYYDADKIPIRSMGDCGLKTFTTPDNCKYIRLTALISTKGIQQIEFGDTATDLEPYTESTATIPIDTLYEGDYLEVYADGSGKIVRESNLLYCKTIKSYDISRDIALLQFEITNPSDTKRTLVKCNSFIQKLEYNFSYEHFYIEGNVINLFIRKDRFSTGLGNLQSEFTSYIQSNPIYFVYYLATPTETPLTAEQVAEFKKLRTFNEVTNINADGTTTVRYYVNTDSGNTVGMLHEQIASVGSYIKALEERLTALENA